MKMGSKVPCIALHLDDFILMGLPCWKTQHKANSYQKEVGLPGGRGVLRKEQIWKQKHLLADLGSGKRGHFVLWRDRDVLTASPLWWTRQNWLLLSEGSLEQSQGASYCTSPWGEAPPLKVVLPSISTSELRFPYYSRLQTGSVKDHRTTWLEIEG